MNENFVANREWIERAKEVDGDYFVDFKVNFKAVNFFRQHP